MQDDHNGESNAEKNMYMQFNLVLSDVSAFLVDGDYSWNQKSFDGPFGASTLLPVIDRCGVSLHLQQVICPCILVQLICIFSTVMFYFMENNSRNFWISLRLSWRIRHSPPQDLLYDCLHWGFTFLQLDIID